MSLDAPLFPKRAGAGGDKSLQGSFRRYVKRDFFELNSIFTHGRKGGNNAGPLAATRPRTESNLSAGLNRSTKDSGLQGPKDGEDGGSKPSVSHYHVDSADPASELPVKFDEQELLGEVCSSVSSKFAARTVRLNRMIQLDKLNVERKKESKGDFSADDPQYDPQCELLIRMCFWYVFVTAWQPEDSALAAEFGRRASDAWQRVRVLSDKEAVDLFSVVFAEAVFQAFPRVFPGNRNTFDDSFCVFLFQILFHLLFGIVIAPTAVHEMRSTYFPTYFETTRNAGTGGLSEIFKCKSKLVEDMTERPVALAKSRSEGFYSKNISTSYSECAAPDHPTFMTPGGPGTTIRFVPFNVRKVRVKTIPIEEEEEPPPPPPPPPEGPKFLTQSELNHALFKQCDDATAVHYVPDRGLKDTASFLPGGEIRMAEFSRGKSHHTLPSTVEWAKQGELRRKQVYVPPHKRSEPHEARYKLYGLPIPKKKTVLEEMREKEQQRLEAEERRRKEAEENARANSREPTPSNLKTRS